MCNPGKQGPQECTSKDIAFPLLWLAGSFEVLRLKVCEVLGKRRLSGEEYRDWIQNGALVHGVPSYIGYGVLWALHTIYQGAEAI